MKRYTRAATILAVGMLCVFAVCRLVMGNALEVRFPVMDLPEGAQLQAEAERPELADVGEPVVLTNSVSVKVIPRAPGASELYLVDGQGEMIGFTVLKISGLLTVYNESDGSFSGGGIALVCLTVFLLGISSILLHGYLSARGPAFYAYSTIFYAGGFLFTFVNGVILLTVTLKFLFRPEEMLMISVYSTICSAGAQFLFYTFPAVFIFSAAMAVSNIELLRHHRPRPESIVGLIVGLGMLAGGLFGIWFSSRDFSGSLMELRINSTIENLYCTAYSYFECMLAGAAVCGLRAARHVPPPDRDAILILGCWFRPDGTLPPLLKSRADQAIDFWKAQKEKTGKEAVLIPSGGQGKDEPMPEAAAIRAYLLSRGIPDSAVLTEEKSASTLQNMAYSRKLMEEHGIGNKVAYATTNYHVFRSGLWAARAGISAEGIGSRTAWWFWPNAFMRECVGLILYRWKLELTLLVCLSLLFGLLSMTIFG